MPRASFFLRITSSQGEAIKGESEEHDFVGAIEVTSWDWGMSDKGKQTQATTASPDGGARGRSSGGGETGGQSYVPTPLRFTKGTDRSTTRLLSGMLKGELFPSATFTLRQQWKTGTGDGSEKDEEFLLHVLLKDVRITSYNFNARTQNVDVDLDEDWVFSYRTIQVDYASAPGNYKDKEGWGLGEELFLPPGSTEPALKKPEVTTRDLEKRLSDMKADNDRLRRSKT
jgi:type VI protein secretion system component Hcp